MIYALTMLVKITILSSSGLTKIKINNMPYIKLRSKNPSASDLRTRLASVRTKNPFVVRLGSRVPLSTYTNPLYQRAEEINTIESIENSRDKLRMKECFCSQEVKQSHWYTFIPTISMGMMVHENCTLEDNMPLN